MTDIDDRARDLSFVRAFTVVREYTRYEVSAKGKGKDVVISVEQVDPEKHVGRGEFDKYNGMYVERGLLEEKPAVMAPQEVVKDELKGINVDYATGSEKLPPQRIQASDEVKMDVNNIVSLKAGVLSELNKTGKSISHILVNYINSIKKEDQFMLHLLYSNLNLMNYLHSGIKNTTRNVYRWSIYQTKNEVIITFWVSNKRHLALFKNVWEKSMDIFTLSYGSIDRKTERE